MKIKCISNRSKDTSVLVLPFDETQPIDNNNIISSFEGFNETTQGGMHMLERGEMGYNLTINAVYLVMAVLILDNEVRYLILDDDGNPGFFPELLFCNIDNTLMYDWSFKNISLCNNRIILISDDSVINKYSDIREIVCRENIQMIKKVIEYKSYIEEYLA